MVSLTHSRVASDLDGLKYTFKHLTHRPLTVSGSLSWFVFSKMTLSSRRIFWSDWKSVTGGKICCYSVNTQYNNSHSRRLTDTWDDPPEEDQQVKEACDGLPKSRMLVHRDSVVVLASHTKKEESVLLTTKIFEKEVLL